MKKDVIITVIKSQLRSDQVEGGWSNVNGMKYGVGGTYSFNSDNYRFWGNEYKKELLEYLNDNIILSFNGLCFDSILLLGENRKLDKNGTTSNNEYSWNNLDIYIEMWRNMLIMDKSNYPLIIEKMTTEKASRDVFDFYSIVNATLNKAKLKNREIFCDLLQEKNFSQLFQYVLYETRLLNKLYQFIKEKKYVVTGSYDIVKFN